MVDVGDRVLVSHRDDPRHLLVNADKHDPSRGILKASDPAGAALVGAAVDDEVNISGGDRTRLATILAIDKARTTRPGGETRVVREPRPPAR